MRPRKYALPTFLIPQVTAETYEKWLSRKAIAHVKRDRKRGNLRATRAEYMAVIHAAVIDSKGIDFYTGEELAWNLISRYRNEDSKVRRRAYKRELAMLPTVDHVGDGLGPANFRICAWRTNDCKNDLTGEELIEFCQTVLAHRARNTALRAPAEPQRSWLAENPSLPAVDPTVTCEN